MPKKRLANLSAADVLKYQLMIAGLSAHAAAHKLGINPRTMYRYLNGDRVVSRCVYYAMLGLIAESQEQAQRHQDRSTKPRDNLGRWAGSEAI